MSRSNREQALNVINAFRGLDDLQRSIQENPEKRCAQDKSKPIFLCFLVGNEYGAFCNGAPWAYSLISIREAVELAYMLNAARPEEAYQFSIVGDLKDEHHSHYSYPELVNFGIGSNFKELVEERIYEEGGEDAVMNCRRILEERSRQFIYLDRAPRGRETVPYKIEINLLDAERGLIDELYMASINSQCEMRGIGYDQILASEALRDKKIERCAETARELKLKPHPYNCG